jgi:phosphoribosyl 1,2-cyclic phosphodiesterase
VNDFNIVFLGTNGSCAYNNKNRKKYGSNSSCVAVRVGDEVLVFDAGSGICGFDGLAAFKQKNLRLFFSHYHIDHMNGLLFFRPLFDAQTSMDVYGMGHDGKPFTYIIDRFFDEPVLHPVGRSALKADLRWHTLTPGDVIPLRDGSVGTISLSHPGGALGYKVEYKGKKLCYCSDIELNNHIHDEAFVHFSQNADLLIMDAYFEKDKTIPGWGHPSWAEAAEWANKTNVKKLALFHYSHLVTDTEIERIEKEAQTIFPHTFAAADGMTMEI